MPSMRHICMWNRNLSCTTCTLFIFTSVSQSENNLENFNLIFDLLKRRGNWLSLIRFFKDLVS